MNLLVLTYHYFHHDTPRGVKRGDEAFSMGFDTLNNHCREITETGFTIIVPETISDRGQYRGDPDRQILITIDDGHQSVLETADIFLKFKITPVLNVIPGLVGHDFYMDWPNLRHLATHGFSIQSHSMSHHDLTRLNDMELKAELEKSKKSIEDNIGTEVTMLASPMGRIDGRVAGAALETGYRVIMTSFAGINTDIDDLKFLRRFQVKRGRRNLGVRRYFSPVSGVRLVGTAKNAAKSIRRRLSR